MRQLGVRAEQTAHCVGETEAKRRLTEYLQVLQGDIGYQLPCAWLSETPEFRLLPSGDWLASRPGSPHEGVLLKSDGTNLPFFGALGRMVPLLNWLPASREYFLGSAFQGRYQIYQKGLAVWESFEGGAPEDDGNAGHPVAQWESIDRRARACSALVAFFDLRDFTNWSASQDPRRVQDTIELFEQSFQNAFSRPWCQHVFAKGTGDGLMVVSEAGRYAAGPAAGEGVFQKSHVKAFCLACAETVQDAATHIPRELTVGCGVTVGPITQLYLLGRFDYIGPHVNEASKMQAIAFGELCLSAAVLDRLRDDGVEVSGKTIPQKGMRVAVADLIAAHGRPTAVR